MEEKEAPVALHNVTVSSSRANLRLVLPLVLGAVLLCAWAIVLYFPRTHYPAMDWFGNDVDYHLVGSLATALFATMFACVAYVLLRVAVRSNQSSRRFAIYCLAILSFALVISVVLMVVPFVAAGWEITGYNDPEGYAPYTWGELGRFLHSFAMFWCDTGFYVTVMSLAAFVGILIAKPNAFTGLQRQLYRGFAAVALVYVLGLLLPFWPSISYWIFD
jgi:hypothetical protein